MKVWERLQPMSPRQLRKVYSIRQGNSGLFFTFADLYGGPQQQMSKKGVFLQRADGTVVSAETYPVSEKSACDGCRIPTYAQPLQDDNPVMNLFTASAFPYPLLLMDTSTVEGRAISLMTFTNKAQPSEYRCTSMSGIAGEPANW